MSGKKLNLAVASITVAGLLQIITIALDQAVIQQEGSLRAAENSIADLRKKQKSIINANLSYGPIYMRWNVEVRKILDNTTGSLDRKKTRLLAFNDNLRNLAEALFSGIDTTGVDNLSEMHGAIVQLINDTGTEVSYRELTTSFTNYGAILDSSQERSSELLTALKGQEERKTSITRSKFTLLVIAMGANILSLVFLLLFFKISLRQQSNCSQVQ